MQAEGRKQFNSHLLPPARGMRQEFPCHLMTVEVNFHSVSQ